MSIPPPTRPALRRYAVSRSLFSPSALEQAIKKLSYFQAEPIRAPARAQDLILRHRVVDCLVDDLEKNFALLPLIEDSIYNYGFFIATNWHCCTGALLSHAGRISWPNTRRNAVRYCAI